MQISFVADLPGLLAQGQSVTMGWIVGSRFHAIAVIKRSKTSQISTNLPNLMGVYPQMAELAGVSPPFAAAGWASLSGADGAKDLKFFFSHPKLDATGSHLGL